MLLAGALLSVSAGAQRKSEEAGSHAQPGPEKEMERKEQSQRALGIMPRFGTTDRQDAPPLTGGGKFHLFARTAFDPFTVGIAGMQAGISQADDQFPGYGQGAAGYGKRFGAAFADEVSSSLFSNFLYPTLFKHDPRYFRLGNGAFKRRLFYGPGINNFDVALHKITKLTETKLLEFRLVSDSPCLLAASAIEPPVRQFE